MTDGAHPSWGGVHALWDFHTCRTIGPGQLLVEVPITGWLTAPDFGYLVGELLDARWSYGELPGVAVQSVAGHCSANQAGQRTLALLIAYRASGAPHRIDGMQMRRHVARAVAEAHAAGRERAADQSLPRRSPPHRTSAAAAPRGGVRSAGARTGV